MSEDEHVFIAEKVWKTPFKKYLGEKNEKSFKYHYRDNYH